jgi:hypothetical protein
MNIFIKILFPNMHHVWWCASVVWIMCLALSGGCVGLMVKVGVTVQVLCPNVIAETAQAFNSSHSTIEMLT